MPRRSRKAKSAPATLVRDATQTAHDTAAAHQQYQQKRDAIGSIGREHDGLRSPLPNGSIVLVEWHDASGGVNYWESVEGALKVFATPRRVFTAGMVIADNADNVVLAQSIDEEDGDVFNVFAVPRGMVKSITLMYAKERL